MVSIQNNNINSKVLCKCWNFYNKTNFQEEKYYKINLDFNNKIQKDLNNKTSIQIKIGLQNKPLEQVLSSLSCNYSGQFGQEHFDIWWEYVMIC